MNQRKIPFYKPALPPLPEYVQLLEKIWESRMLSNFSKFSQELEEKAASYLNSPYVKAVVSGDIGLMITLKALELPPGASCYISDFTFNSTINAALWAGLRPVLVDIDRETFNISTDALSEKIKKRGGPGVVLATHVFGNPADIESLKSIAREHECFLIFDAAHALGSKSNDQHIGCFGDAEIFSLSGTKLVTSAEGGLISTPHKWLAEKLIYMRAYGFQNDYNSRYVGLNGKISELHCALGILGLERIEEFLQKRREIVARYQQNLAGRVKYQKVRSEDRSTYKDVAIGTGERTETVEQSLHSQGIQTKRYFLPLHVMKPYMEFADGNYPATEHVYNTTICIPAYSDLCADDLDLISDRILRALDS